ncbi:Aste57867_23460 [Aphanomyces stellatus]|uniref:Aste57867_23460 protein n=1 Tax=Aphanomyces stellatus TaxID=120398 RepID=A0A485LMX7_9STRA|nr:hypothetical protein As57867_023389 [Aphanomyces stellatus]VFU00105.1 Aste57867_23460 [Aphanomyces stellatus]
MPEDDDPSTLCDVFEQMLQVNEDLLAAVAEQQQWDRGDPSMAAVASATAYQQLLHKNLLEMADFVDSLCGVFVSVDASSAEVPAQKKPRTDDGHSKETSLLLSTIQANENLRARRRSEKRFLSFQKKVKEQEDHVPDKVPLPLMYPPPPPPPPLPTPLSLKAHGALMLRPCPLPMPTAPNVSILPGKNRLVVAKEECLACHRLGKTVKDCRTVWKHITPSWKTSLPPPPPPAPVSLLPPVAFPPMIYPFMPFALPLATKPAAANASSTPRTTFKRMCVQCKTDHQSLYQCRTVLQHTDPEWKRPETPGAGGATQRSYSRWTDAEMQTFHELVEVHGYRDVSKLALYLQTKDKKQVKSYLQRYLKSKQDGDPTSVMEMPARQCLASSTVYGHCKYRSLASPNAY